MNIIYRLFLLVIFAPLGLYGMTSEPNPKLCEYELSPEARLAAKKRRHKKLSPVQLRKTAVYNSYINSHNQKVIEQKSLNNQEVIEIALLYQEAFEHYDPTNSRAKSLYNEATILIGNLCAEPPEKFNKIRKAVEAFWKQCEEPPASSKNRLDNLETSQLFDSEEQEELNDIFNLIDEDLFEELDSTAIEDKEAAILGLDEEDYLEIESMDRPFQLSNGNFYNQTKNRTPKLSALLLHEQMN